jgi:ribosomal subunit interface protein
MEPSDALKSYAEDKLARVAKYIDEPIAAQVYLTVEKIRHSAEVTITAKGITIKASEETSDMYAAVDLVTDKIERQLKRYKERLKGHKPGACHHPQQDLFHQAHVRGRGHHADGPDAQGVLCLYGFVHGEHQRGLSP